MVSIKRKTQMKYKLLLTGLFGISSLAQAVVVEGTETGETAEVATAEVFSKEDGKVVTASSEVKEVTFEQLVDDLLIEPINKNTISKFELTSTALVEVKDENGNNIEGNSGDLVFELPFKISLDKEYTKSIRKVFTALKDSEGKSFSLYSTEINTANERNINQANVSEEKLNYLMNKLTEEKAFKLRLVLEEKDGTELTSIQPAYNHRLSNGGYIIKYNNEFQNQDVISSLIEDKGFKPQISQSNLTFFTGSVEGKILFGLSKDLVNEINNGGKIKVDFVN